MPVRIRHTHTPQHTHPRGASIMVAAAAASSTAAAEGAAALTTAQFVILSENQRNHAALEAARDAHAHLQAEHRLVLQQLEESTQESYSVSEHFRQEVLAAKQRIAELEQQHEQLRAQSDARVAQLQAAADARHADQQAEFEALSGEMMARIEQLFAEVQGLQQFRQHKAEWDTAMAALRDEAAGLRQALEAQRTQLERHFGGLNAKMRKEYEQRLEELKRCQEEELEARLDASVKRILGANRRMVEELRLHITESDALHAEVRLLTCERALLNRELSVKTDMEASLALRAGQQAAALKEAQAKTASLEQSLAQVLSDFAAERVSVVASAASQVQAAQDEVDGLRRLLRLKGRELQQLRQLAQEVLLQRSEVEVFLLSSLHHVREHTNKGDGGARQPEGQPDSGAQPEEQQPEGSSVPVGEPDACASTNAAAAATGLDIVEVIGQLSWADRERVLRLLFAKLHGRTAAQPHQQQEQRRSSPGPQPWRQATHPLIEEAGDDQS